MLARRLPTILPPLESDEALEVTRIHSAAGHAPVGGLARSRPFRAPHHTASIPALVGGGSQRPHPGEVTLAHRGTLFPRRAGRVPSRRARRAAPAARGTRRAHLAPAHDAEPAGRLPARRVHEPLPVRARTTVVRVLRGATGALPTAAVGTAARSLRPPARRAPTGTRRGRPVRRRPSCAAASRTPGHVSGRATEVGG